MKQYRTIILFILVLLCANFVSANFVAKVTSDKGSIFPWEEAFFTIKVTNKEKYSDTLIYKFPDMTDWSMITDPLYTQRTIRPNETLTTAVRIKPSSDNVYPKQYNLDFNVISKRTGEIDKGTFSIIVKDKRYAEYMPNVNIIVVLPESLDPRYDATLSVYLKNLVPVNLSDFTLEIGSEINPGNNEKVVVPLKDLASTEANFQLSYDDYQAPATEYITIHASIPSKNISFDPITKEIRLLSFSKLKQEVSVEKSFLKTVTIVTFYNDGNVIANDQYRMQTTFLRGLFTSSDPGESEFVQESGFKYMVFENSFMPREKKTITVTVNYRPLFVVLILIVLAIILYYMLRSPIIIRKETRSLSGKSGPEEGLSRVKVLLHLKNRTGRVISDINITDRVPHIAFVEKDLVIGTLQPSVIGLKDSKSTLVKWQIESLEPYEERIISYIIDSKLTVIGTMTLSSATVRFKNLRGNVSKVKSNSVLVE